MTSKVIYLMSFLGQFKQFSCHDYFENFGKFQRKGLCLSLHQAQTFAGEEPLECSRQPNKISSKNLHLQ